MVIEDLPVIKSNEKFSDKINRMNKKSLSLQTGKLIDIIMPQVYVNRIWMPGCSGSVTEVYLLR